MISDSRIQNSLSSPYIPEKESLTISYYKEGEFRGIAFETVAFLTVQELCNKPFIFRFDIPREGRVYFTESEEVFLKIKGDGKYIRWLHELFEIWKQDLILKGFPKDISIYYWRLKDISVLQKALIIFRGSEMEVRQ